MPSSVPPAFRSQLRQYLKTPPASLRVPLVRAIQHKVSTMLPASVPGESLARLALSDLAETQLSRALFALLQAPAVHALPAHAQRDVLHLHLEIALLKWLQPKAAALGAAAEGQALHQLLNARSS